MFQSKDLDRLNGYKNKTYKYAAYKRHTSDQKTHRDWQWQHGKRISCKCKSKETGVPILISDRIGFKAKTIIRDKLEYYIVIKGSIQEEKKNIYIYIYTQHRII